MVLAPLMVSLHAISRFRAPCSTQVVCPGITHTVTCQLFASGPWPLHTQYCSPASASHKRHTQGNGNCRCQPIFAKQYACHVLGAAVGLCEHAIMVVMS